MASGSDTDTGDGFIEHIDDEDDLQQDIYEHLNESDENGEIEMMDEGDDEARPPKRPKKTPKKVLFKYGKFQSIFMLDK